MAIKCPFIFRYMQTKNHYSFVCSFYRVSNLFLSTELQVLSLFERTYYLLQKGPEAAKAHRLASEDCNE